MKDTLALFKRHFKLLFGGFIVALWIEGLSFLIPCNEGFLIGGCAIGNILFASMLIRLFVIWAFVTTVIQIMIWSKKQTAMKISWYVMALVFILFAAAIYEYVIFPPFYAWKETKQFNTHYCVHKDGHNSNTFNGIRTESECKNGKLNGKKLEFENNQLVHEETYSNGKPSGTEIFYNSDGATTLYIVNRSANDEYGDSVYARVLEDSIEKRTKSSVDESSQKYLCSHIYETSKTVTFTCKGTKIDGTYKGLNNTTGEVFEEFHLIDGVLNGPAIRYKDGEITEYAEYKNGVLHGRVYSKSNGVLTYEGHYENGLQSGVFTMYNFVGEIESKVLFEKGKIVKVIEFKRGELHN